MQWWCVAEEKDMSCRLEGVYIGGSRPDPELLSLIIELVVKRRPSCWGEALTKLPTAMFMFRAGQIAALGCGLATLGVGLDLSSESHTLVRAFPDVARPLRGKTAVFF